MPTSLTTLSPNDYTKAAVSIFSARRQPENVAAMEKYMKDQFAFLGIRAPDLQRMTKQFFAEFGLPAAQDMRAVLAELWNQPEREYQYLGVAVLQQFAKSLKHAEDFRLDWLEYAVTHKSWWDTVDVLAAHVAGSWLKLASERIEEQAIRWADSDNLWLARTAILCQLTYKGSTDEGLLYSVIERNISSREFFICKAIGWALREYSKTNPNSVISFVESHPELSGLSRREALKVIERKDKR